MTPYLSEIRMFAFAFAPKGWALCNGQILPISQNQALFSLIGTFYGGNGQTNFALPDLRGRVALHQSGAHPVGEVGGENAVTLSVGALPPHTHTLKVTDALGNSADPTSKHLAQPNAGIGFVYGNTPSGQMGLATVSSTGGNQPHENRMPTTAMVYCIALQGIFPSRN